jgi:hypothetical protein
VIAGDRRVPDLEGAAGADEQRQIGNPAASPKQPGEQDHSVAVELTLLGHAEGAPGAEMMRVGRGARGFVGQPPPLELGDHP